MAPWLTIVVDKYIELGYSGTKSASFITQGMDWIQSAVGRVLDGVNALQAGFYGIRTAIDKVVSLTATGFDAMFSVVDATLSAMQALGGGMNATIDAAIAKSRNAIQGFRSGVQVFREEIEKAADDDWAKAKEKFNAIGKGGITVRKLVDDVEKAANERAKLAADKTKNFLNPGELNRKHEELKFAGAEAAGARAPITRRSHPRVCNSQHKSSSPTSGSPPTTPARP